VPPTQQMQVQVIDRLPAVRAGVHHYAVAGLESLRPRQLRRDRHQVPKHRRVRFGRVRHRGHMLLGDNQQVLGRLRMNIDEGERVLILVQTLRRNRSGDDTTEETIGSHGVILTPPRADPARAIVRRRLRYIKQAMPLDPNHLRILVIVLFFAALFAGKIAKGKARQTPEGLSFPMKPVFTAMRFLALPLYYAFFFYWYWEAHHVVSWPMTILFILVMVLMATQSPGTIVLTPTAIVQHYWLLKDKVIPYSGIMALQKTSAGRSITILGDNRVRITHTSNHSDPAGFEQAIEQRTGKKVLL